MQAPRTRITSTSGIPHKDVGDITTSPGWLAWHPIGYNARWVRYLNTLIGQVTASRPDVVLHTGDMVEGRWTSYAKPSEGRPFGPVDRAWQRRRAIKRAGTAYYSWISSLWKDYDVIWGMGDHEIGDMGPSRIIYPSDARYRLHTSFKEIWRSQLGRWGNSRYSVRKGPVGILTLDPFHKWKMGIVPVISRSDRIWMRDTVNRMRRNGVRWFIVQCEIPTRTDNNRWGTSGIMLRNSAQIEWLLRDLKVDLFLTAEFHDITVHTNNGRRPVQIVHGGAETQASWLNIAAYDQRLDLELWESMGGHTGTGRVWAMSNARAWARPTSGTAERVGTATLWRAGGLTRRTGVFAVEGLG